jgi:hypothetical protein
VKKKKSSFFIPPPANAPALNTIESLDGGLRYIPDNLPDEIAKYPQQLQEAAHRLCEKFWVDSGSRPDWKIEPIRLQWVVWLLPKLAESSEEEISSIMDWALKERYYWIGQLLTFWHQGNYDDSMDRFRDEFFKIAQEYFAHRRIKEAEEKQIQQMEHKAKVLTNLKQASRMADEPAQTYQKEEYRIDDKKILAMRRKEREDAKAASKKTTDSNGK